ncbi:MAG: hypothetical protein AVDCRST_MAG78-403 [uncultured Rubrobacteraceae bacterium]|uniref:DUF2231 domain-containing protein n=1 Tax=uncultured Rubrobacteraceae bacterium TaxID=349277 RepID=A0A6J4PH73_9ACTN|nr:MAG: hypothetical protein AVDCRST_MAG78-403 [uncultured Rubrobacteraceae bacterium]
MGDFFTFENLMNHLHGALNHFPIALLFASAGLDFVAGKRPSLRSSAWLLLVLGTLGAIAATVSGLLAHLAYEDDPYLLSAMEVHQYLAFATTGLFVALTAWRWRSSRRGSDIGGNRLYSALALLGLVLLGITGFLGGNLLTEYGIGVRGITR